MELYEEHQRALYAALRAQTQEEVELVRLHQPEDEPEADESPPLTPSRPATGLLRASKTWSLAAIVSIDGLSDEDADRAVRNKLSDLCGKTSHFVVTIACSNSF